MELEHALLAVPGEELYGNLRAHKKFCDRKAEEFRALLTRLGTITDATDLRATLEDFRGAIEAFRLGLEEWDSEAQAYLEKLRRRVAVLLSEAGIEEETDQSLAEATLSSDGAREPSEIANDSSKFDNVSQSAMWGESVVFSPDNVPVDATQHRLLRFLVDFLLRQGYLETAKLAVDQWGLAPLVDMTIFETAEPVLRALRAHRCTEALQYCAEQRRRLARINSSLELHLRVQEFIELCRSREVNAAVLYARKHFNGLLASKPAENVSTAAQEEYALVKRCVTLLAYPPETSCEPYRRLYDLQRWDALAEEFLNTHFELNMLPSVPLIDLLMQPGLAALKTRQCKSDQANAETCPSSSVTASGRFSFREPGGDADETLATTLENDADPEQPISMPGSVHSIASRDRARFCPTCIYPFSALAKDLPYSTHTHSILVCRVTGKLMDEHNPPIVLPNGNVYSNEAVDMLTQERSDGRFVIDPATGHEFSRELCRKVFIM
jgi:macrophage erythroblast attacher